ncbi:MAG TPA: alkyl hydroperoxide reductase subunit F [Polyangiales bacterium]|nr:alkyl hydroperoxide reductase subunit F [Polyangiales bacterium]
MLEVELKEQLKAYLERLRHPIELSANLGDDEVSRETRALLADIAEASSLVSIVEEPSHTLRAPSFGIRRPGEPTRVRFAGLPLGHEFTSLVLALLHVGGHPPRVSDDELTQIESLPGPFAFETYFSQSCQSCPDVVQALNLLAARNPNITHTAIDGSAYEAEVTKREIMGVPAIYLNGEHFGQGRMELSEILAKIDTAAASARDAALADKGLYDVLIVGGGPAGAAAAVYAARKGIRTGLVAERFGGQVMDTLGIENYPSVLATEGPIYGAALEQQVKHYEVDLIKNQRAHKLVAGETPGVELASGATLRARTLILATGARWRDMNVPGEKEYRTKGVTYCPHCDGPLFKGKRVAVIGGGNSGVEAGIDLAGVVGHVTVIEFMDELKADAVLQRKLKSLPNVDVIVSARTTEVLGDGKKVVGLSYENRKTGEQHTLELDGIFVQIGLLPNTEWLKGAIDLTKFGEIVIDAKGHTSIPGVFAAGDATTVPFKQIVIAAGDGAKAALSAFDYLIRATAPAA